MKTLNPLKTLTLLLMLTSGTLVSANDSTKVDLSVGTDLVSHYVWRGLLLSNSPSIQPSMGITYCGFSFGSWASYSVSPSAFQEVDLYMSYSIGSITVGVNDYFNPNDSLGFDNNYFNYSKNTTLHSLEPFISFSEIGGTPFSATAGVFVYGNDRDDEGNSLYSSYLELSYATNVKDYGLNIFGGATLGNGYYASKAAIVNLGVSISKELKVMENFTIPCKGSFIVNPNTQNVFLVFGFTF
jgi:hypothetical protein